MQVCVCPRIIQSPQSRQARIVFVHCPINLFLNCPFKLQKNPTSHLQQFHVHQLVPDTFSILLYLKRRWEQGLGRGHWTQIVALIVIHFHFQIMFVIGLNFAFTVFLSFGIFVIISYQNDAYPMIIGSISWLAYYFLFVFKIIGLGSATTKEGKRMAVLIHKTINFEQNKFVLDSVRPIASSSSMPWANCWLNPFFLFFQLCTFSQQQLFQYPVLTCGLFNFDWTLLFTVSTLSARPPTTVLTSGYLINI